MVLQMTVMAGCTKFNDLQQHIQETAHLGGFFMRNVEKKIKFLYIFFRF